MTTFALKKTARENALQPHSTKIWIQHGISEFIGTFLLALGLAGISISANSQNIPAEEYFFSPVLLGFYAGFVVVGVLLVIFLRWSCDLNPAVSIYRGINGTNTWNYVGCKVFVQFAGAIIAGLVVYALGHLNSNSQANTAISALTVSQKIFQASEPSISRGALLIFGLETLLTMILMWPIFTSVVRDKYRVLTVCFIISLDVFMGILGGTAALNPARGLTQQIPALFFGMKQGGITSKDDLLSATLAMEAGTLFAPWALALLQDLTKKILNPGIEKLISWQNNHRESLTKPKNK